MRRLSLSTRILLSHVLVATLTCFIGMLALTLLISSSSASGQSDRLIAMISGVYWMYEIPEEEQPGFNMPPGFTLVLAPDEDRVLHASGLTPCEPGDLLADCLPQPFTAENRRFELNGITWSQVMLDTITGSRVFAVYPRLSSGFITPSLLIPTAVLALMSMPVALALAWLTAGRLTKRLSRLTHANRRFAQGDFTVRVPDTHKDDVGILAQQFNSMADVLQQNVDVLRDLARRNTELVGEAEQSAVIAERVRLSRDLHDSISQQLFGLSVNAATLPDVIRQTPEKGIEQARYIASLAEKAQLDLRALLVDLRPSRVLEQGFEPAFKRLCEAWSQQHNIALEQSLVLRGNHLPAAVEDTLFRVTEEALSNIARHAQARHVDVSLLEGQRQITLSITDDGSGFDSESRNKDGHFGLIGMRERVRAIGGQIAIDSETARGTTIRVHIPIER